MTSDSGTEDVLSRIEQATCYTAVIADVPALIVLPRFHGMFVNDDDLVDADAWTSAVRAAGAREPEDLDFLADLAPGWRVVMDPSTAQVRVELPEGLGGGYLYAGELVADPAWYQQVEQDHREAALEMMERPARALPRTCQRCIADISSTT